MIRTLKSISLTASMLALAACGGPSGPEELAMNGRPVSGEITLGRNFSEDVIERDVQAGGVIRAQSIPELAACTGGITAAPTVKVRFSRREGQFHLRASSRGDTTLIVHTPSGQWLCSDDAIGFDPVIPVPIAERGEYQVWVGAYDAGEIPATLSIAPTPYTASGRNALEQGLMAAMNSLAQDSGSTASAASTPLRPDRRPLHGRIDFRAGRGNVEQAEVDVSPDVPLSQAVRHCRGHATARPSLIVRHRNGGGAPFAISAGADFDATIAVRLPDGSWDCNDDAWGLNPGLTIMHAERGDYAVYVGSLNRGAGGTAQVYVSDEHYGPQQGRK